MSSGEAKNSSADRQVSSKSKHTRHVAAGHQRRRAPSASSAPRASPVGGARASRQQNDRAPRGKRGGMQRMSDEDMMLVEAKREMQEGQGHGGSSSSTLPVSSRGAAATPTRLYLGGKRPRCSLDGGGGSDNDSKVSVSLSVKPPKKKKKKKNKREKREKTRTPTGAGSSTSSSPPPASAAAPRPRPDRAATAGTAGAAAAGGTGAPSPVHPAGAARRGVRGGGGGVEVVRHVSVEERIAENQRRRGVIDIRDGGGVAPRVVPLAAGARSAPPGGAARAAARRGGGGGGGSGGGSGSGGARRGGGVPCNLAVAEGWTQSAASSVPLPVKLEASGAQGTSNNAPARLPAPATPVAASAALAPAAPPPPANGGGGGGGGGGEVSVSDIFRERGVKFHIKLAATVGIRAKKMYVQECGKVAGKLLRKRPALDRYMNEMPAPWDWGRSVPENVYPASYRGMLHEAFDSVFGVVAP